MSVSRERTGAEHRRRPAQPEGQRRGVQGVVPGQQPTMSNISHKKIFMLHFPPFAVRPPVQLLRVGGADLLRPPVPAGLLAQGQHRGGALAGGGRVRDEGLPAGWGGEHGR